MTNRLLLAAFVLFVAVKPMNAQTIMQPEKAGGLIIKSENPGCGSPADQLAFTRNLNRIAEWFHQNNLVLKTPRGFLAWVHLTSFCPELKPLWGGSINISFRYFYTENGKEETATGWSAHDTDILLNRPIYNLGTRIDEAEFKTGDPPQLKQPLEKALESLHQYYMVLQIAKEIAPGIRLYQNGRLVVYNPDRPYIWIPVTVKEFAEAKLSYYKVKQGIDDAGMKKANETWAKLDPQIKPVNGPSLFELLTKEYSSFKPEELNEWAYTDGAGDGIFGINGARRGRQIMKLNEEYWNKSLPGTAVQFISMDYRPQSQKELDDFPRRNYGLLDYVGLFMNALDPARMSDLIQK
jgi:hypothetical protein